ncbi:MAG: hypothetical protein U0936_06965 [Planctomycetaceae bacterium]
MLKSCLRFFVDQVVHVRAFFSRTAFDRAMVWTVDHRRTTALAVLVITLLAVLGYVRPQAVRELFVSPATEEKPVAKKSGKETARAVPNIDAVSLSQSDAVMVVQSEIIIVLYSAGSKGDETRSEYAGGTDYVDRILWMDRVPMLNIFGLSEPLFPRSEAFVERFKAAKEKAMNHLSSAGIWCQKTAKPCSYWSNSTGILCAATNSARRNCGPWLKKPLPSFRMCLASFMVTGDTPARITYMKAHEANQVKYQLTAMA